MSQAFHKILIANRGEVAVRIIRACQQLNIATVAVYSDADKHSPHVALADEAIHVGASEAAASYLNQETILQAAEATQADAIHPGFGFLSENAAFAEKCRTANIVFIGPDTKAMTLMASKAESKQLVESLALPVIPGHKTKDQSLEALSQAAETVGFPVLIKASAGGGGMGMRVVHQLTDFADALLAAKQEAKSAFGDDNMLIEKYFEHVRHIEVQLVADQQGKVLHCFERECSIQRRRQKVVEEAPSASVNESLRNKLTTAAVKIAEAVNYIGLGTVEFMVEDGTENFYFLEMNTRLQVEHGITEEITGLDLVKLQIEIAEGKALTLDQSDIHINGHAIECRLYAEDAAQDFAPSVGHILHWQPHNGPNLRTDAGISTGVEVTTYYDPMLAKLIGKGKDRTTAIRSTRQHVQKTQILGLTSNQKFLDTILSHPDFVAGNTCTSFIDEHKEALQTKLQESEVIQTLLVAAIQRACAQELGKANHEPSARRYTLAIADETYHLDMRHTGFHSYSATLNDQHYQLEILANTTVHDEHGHHISQLSLSINGHSQHYTTTFERNRILIHTNNTGSVEATYLSRFSSRELETDGAGYQAAMPGRIIEVLATVGSQVKTGDKLLTMESMKMEHSTLAKSDGIVTELFVVTGDAVNKGDTLIEIDALEL